MGVSETKGSPKELDVDRWVDDHADALFRYAVQRVRRRDTAEELVQETFLAALRARHKFDGQSTERTWLVGILRHKIVDHIRRVSKDRSQRRQPPEDGSVEQCFTAQGHWKNGSCDWGADPAVLVEKSDFWNIFERCFAALPQPLADTFALREMEDRPPADVCANLEISESNLWVRLHRARVLLKECLDKHWFKQHTG